METVDDLSWTHGEISEAWRLALQQPPGRWRTKRGEVVELRDVTDAHLTNIARMLLGYVQTQLQLDSLAAYEAVGMFQGEMARYACESEGDAAFRAALTTEGTLRASRCHKLREVVDEMRRRGLALPNDTEKT